MTYLQTLLLEQAQSYWEQGRDIPLHLASQIAQEGMDLPALEIKFKKEPSNG
ncbi:hypothetical protein [Aquabacterium sp.]|uniref:hypothetical protein n=1 Tax=Aquabacterium sp. TaxID=1872578 RepID=UPI004037E84A